MISVEQQDEIVELAIEYIQRAQTEQELAGIGDEIRFLKTEVPLRKKATDRLKERWLARRQELTKPQ
jgi:hypothetical protein